LALALVALMVGTLSPYAVATEQATWSTDGAHTEINFSVNHFFTPVTGSFEDYEVTLAYNDAHPEESSVEARINVASVNTGNQKRDEHLRSADWFEAEKYPYMTFKSDAVRRVADNQFIASGPLTIKGKSQQVELPITLLGTQKIPPQMQPMLSGTTEVASFQTSTAIDRGDFGVGVGSWAADMVVGNEIGIEILLEAHTR
jgi:polyisoprenoid-binding protein YceI